MATVNGVRTNHNQMNVESYLFETLTTTNRDGAPIKVGDAESISIQAQGTFGASASIALQGSNDGSTYADLADGTGTAIALTAASINSAGDTAMWVRPYLSDGDGSTDIDVDITVKRTKAGRS